MAMADKSLKLIVFTCAMALLFGCQQQPSGGRRAGPNGGAKQTSKTVVAYNSDIKPLIKKYCLSCHNGTQVPDLSTYASTKKAAFDIYLNVKSGAMPQAKKDRWTTKQVQLVRQWIDGGLLVNTATTAKLPKEDPEEDPEEDPAEDPADEKEQESEDEDIKEPAKPKVTYDLNVKKIMTSYCIKCHGSGGNLPELDTKKKVIAAGDAVLDSVLADRMPKTGALRASEKDVIEAWVAGGKL